MIPLLLLLLTPAPAAAAPVPAWTEVPRKVLALYTKDSIPDEFKDVFNLPLHQRLELPLNHLGLEVVYQEASGALPEPASLKGYRGVLTWFTGPVNFRDPRPVCRWLRAALRGGLKVAVLGNPGLYVREGAGVALPSECSDMLRALGVDSRGTLAVDPLGVKVASADASVMGFERRVDASEKGRVPAATLLPGGTAFLRLSLPEQTPDHSEPVAVTRSGGLALEPFFLYANSELAPPQYRWTTNPFAFFEAVFGLKGLPRGDVSTLNGRRVYFTQVDGDGFFNRSELDPQKTSAEVFLKEFVDPQRDSPFTLSVIAGYYDLALYNSDASRALTRRLLNNPNVEPASHGYAHPLVWHKRTVALVIPRYAMDARKEVFASKQIIDSLFLPSSKRVGLFLWTGDCQPSAAEARLPEEAGMLNLNGGGGRFDASFPSYSFLFPYSRLLGAARQVYSPMYNEESFTNVWSGPYYGFRDVVETFARTGAPRRVKPVDVYAHYFSLDKYAGFQALKKVYAWTRAQPLNPVRASFYARSVVGFFALQVSRSGAGRFRFSGAPDLRTVRFDSETGTPDLALSKGVIGFKRELGSLYVFFDATEPRELALSPNAPALPHLEDANFEVTRWERSGGTLRFDKSGWWTSECVLAGLVPGRSYRVRGAGLDASLRADAAGRLRLAFPDSERGGPARPVLVEPG